MGTVSELAPRRKPESPAHFPRLWLLRDADMTFTGTDGELAATLRFLDLHGALIAILITAKSHVRIPICCGQALRLRDLGMTIALLAVERRVDAWRLLLEFRPIVATS